MTQLPMKLLCLISFFVCFTVSADGLSDQQMQNAKALKGTFTQSKNIKLLKRPFRSNGTFVYIPDKGLLWQTIKPVKSIKLFTDGAVFSLDKQGKLKKQAQVDNDFFIALFSANQEKLNQYFSLDKLASSASCQMLIPKNDTMRSIISGIYLCLTDSHDESTLGSTQMPRKIILIEAKGNRTEILLQLSKEFVSKEELAYFDQY